MRIQVLVRLKPGVLDVQGKAIENGIHGLGFSETSNVRMGRLIELDIDAATPDAANKRVKEICDKLLANPIIENYEIRPA